MNADEYARFKRELDELMSQAVGPATPEEQAMLDDIRRRYPVPEDGGGSVDPETLERLYALKAYDLGASVPRRDVVYGLAGVAFVLGFIGASCGITVWLLGRYVG